MKSPTSGDVQTENTKSLDILLKRLASNGVSDDSVFY